MSECTHDCSSCSQNCASRQNPQDFHEPPHQLSSIKKVIGVVSGKGGIGKSTTVSNLASALARQGYRVFQIGCDPKADSTVNHNGGERIPTILDVVRQGGGDDERDFLRISPSGVYCMEAGGPLPGTGCAGRGIIAAFEKLDELDVYEKYRPDFVLYDVLGDVVCGGFAMPIREGYAEKVFLLTSGENMAIHAAANIALAVEHFADRGYASLGGIILNRRGVPREEEKVRELRELTDNALVVHSLDKKTLSETGIQNCDVAVVCIGEHIEPSILTTLNLVDLGVKKVIAKATSAEHGEILRRLGAEPEE